MRTAVPMRDSKRKRDEWEIQDDLRTLKRAAEIRNDPDRLDDVKNLIQTERAAEKQILGIQTPPAVSRRRNPATIMPLDVDY